MTFLLSKVAISKQYPTPLRFLWNSELDVFAKASVPDVNDILSSGTEYSGKDAADK